MQCPHKDSLIPRCDFRDHPWRKHIQYCHTCGNWRDLDQIGQTMPNWLLFVFVLVVITILLAAMSSEQQPETSSPEAMPTESELTS